MYSVEVLKISGNSFYVIAQMGSGSRLFRWRKGERVLEGTSALTLMIGYIWGTMN